MLQVESIFPHPLYRGIKRKYGDDVAIVQLAKSVKPTKTISPICVDESIELRVGDQFQAWANKLFGVGESTTQSLPHIQREWVDIVDKGSSINYVTHFMGNDDGMNEHVEMELRGDLRYAVS